VCRRAPAAPSAGAATMRLAARLPASAAGEVLCICFRTLCESSTHACCLLCGRHHGCRWVIAEW